MIKPEELTSPVFKTGLRGYNTAEVDSYIERLIGEYKELYAHSAELEENLRTAVEKYKATKTELNTLKQLTDTIIREADEEAEKKISEAESKAEKAKAAMKESCSEILGSYSELFENEKKKLVELEEKSRNFREMLLEAYKTHITEIQKNMPALDAESIASLSFESKVAEAFKRKIVGDTSADGEIGNPSDN